MQFKRDVSKITCYNCNETGHYKRDCPKLSGKPSSRKHFERANNVVDGNSDSEVVFMCSDGADQQSWYIDSGATQHMSGDRDAFVEYESIPAKAVYMGDNNKQDAVGQGSVKMVLGVGGRQVNAKLMSASKGERTTQGCKAGNFCQQR